MFNTEFLLTCEDSTNPIKCYGLTYSFYAQNTWLTQGVTIKGPVRPINFWDFKYLVMGDWDGWLDHPEPKNFGPGHIARAGGHLLGAKIG